MRTGLVESRATRPFLPTEYSVPMTFCLLKGASPLTEHAHSSEIQTSVSPPVPHRKSRETCG